ncbi:hypothetical protein ES708_09139 [subsurface metagenome]
MSRNSDKIQYVLLDTPLRLAIQRWVDVKFPNHRIPFTPVLHNNLVLFSVSPVAGHYVRLHIPFDEIKPYLPTGCTGSPLDL